MSGVVGAGIENSLVGEESCFVFVTIKPNGGVHAVCAGGPSLQRRDRFTLRHQCIKSTDNVKQGCSWCSDLPGTHIPA